MDFKIKFFITHSVGQHEVRRYLLFIFQMSQCLVSRKMALHSVYTELLVVSIEFFVNSTQFSAVSTQFSAVKLNCYSDIGHFYGWWNVLLIGWHFLFSYWKFLLSVFFLLKLLVLSTIVGSSRSCGHVRLAPTWFWLTQNGKTSEPKFTEISAENLTRIRWIPRF